MLPGSTLFTLAHYSLPSLTTGASFFDSMPSYALRFFSMAAAEVPCSFGSSGGLELRLYLLRNDSGTALLTKPVGLLKT